MTFTERQIEIIESATKLIGSKGIQNLTTKNLAAEMKFTEPALYRHFKDKAEILNSVLIYYKSKLRDGLSSVISSELTGIEKIKAVLEFQFKHFSEHPAVIMVIFAETSFQYDKVLSKAVSGIMIQKKKMLVQIIKSGQEDNSIRKDIEAKQLAVVVMGSMRMTVLRWRLSNFNFDLIAEGNLLWRTIELLIKKN